MELDYNAHELEDLYVLGCKYRNGDGVEKDLEKSAQIFLELANKEHISAQLNLGYMYICGHGVELDPFKSVFWYKKAARKNVLAACYNLALSYGANMTDVEKAYWAVKAAKLGSIEMQRKTAINYEFGQGVVQNYIQAYMWYNIAQANGEDVKEQITRVVEYMDREQIAHAQEEARMVFEEIYYAQFEACEGLDAAE